MSKPPELNYRPLSDGRYEVWLHAVVTQDALLGLHGVLAQYGAEGPPEAPEPEDPTAAGEAEPDEGGGRAH
ncbi:MAG: hypothetical protein Q8L59_13565 [Phenylobacterium sp.]|uniref:hypothetical protein n=1 Tax=Phenylobacterium sp. TaxID=1871053 RepID=UPI0027348B5F|nr:hypothetical protein [Phenylobacterium sp.]MDP1643198.1 hypothetical protein [Phenylobacterium sp.]MDP3118362.1 hypothetical protein [Phenylobacterium sp.]MDP3385124.1 hypothetical protein [Phenylobacterium sp.]